MIKKRFFVAFGLQSLNFKVGDSTHRNTSLRPFAFGCSNRACRRVPTGTPHSGCRSLSLWPTTWTRCSSCTRPRRSGSPPCSSLGHCMRISECSQLLGDRRTFEVKSTLLTTCQLAASYSQLLNPLLTMAADRKWRWNPNQPRRPLPGHWDCPFGKVRKQVWKPF